MAKFSVENSAVGGPEHLMTSKSTLKDAAGKTLYPTPGSKKGNRFPDIPIQAQPGTVGTVEVKTPFAGSPMDPLDAASTSKQLANERAIMSQGPTYWGPKDNLTPVVPGEGPGITTGWWVWFPPKNKQ